MKRKISLAATAGLLLFLIVMHVIRVIDGSTNLREQAEKAAKVNAELLGEIAEGLFLEESYDAIQVRLNRAADKLQDQGVAAVAFDSEFETGIATYGDFGDFEREIVPEDKFFNLEDAGFDDLVFQKYFMDSGTALWLRVNVSATEILKNELKYFGMGCIGVIVLAYILSVILNRIAVKPTMLVAERLEAIAAGEADLTQRLEIQSQDEIGQLANAFDQLMRHLQSLVEKIAGTASQISTEMTTLKASSDDVNNITMEIVRTIQEISKGASQQSEETENILRISENVFQFAEQVFQSATEARNVAQMVTKSAFSGRQSVEDMRNKITTISEVNQQAVASVLELSQKSQQISTIVETIDHISRQVNLLALNAAIEAARAGEYGRGFGVVAEEIRKLASQTDSATKKIISIIEEIEKTTSVTVEQTEAVSQKVNEGEEVIRSSSTIFEKIASETDRSAGAIQTISDLASQQKEMVTTLVKTVEGIATVAESNAAGSQEVAASTEEQTASIEEITANIQEVFYRVNELLELVEKFKT